MYELYRYILPAHKTNFNPFGSQPLTLRALRLPLPQGTALMMTALRAALRFKFLRTYATNNGIRSETARFSDDKTRLSERTDVEAVAAR